MNGCIASFYIIIGTFDSLVTFIGTVHPSRMTKASIQKLLNLKLGISEYIFFLLAALGIFILRHRESAPNRSYRTWTCNPIIFCLFSTLILIRGIVTDPTQGLTVLFLTLVGWAVYKRRFL